MTRSEIKQIIREEIKYILKESFKPEYELLEQDFDKISSSEFFKRMDVTLNGDTIIIFGGQTVFYPERNNDSETFGKYFTSKEVMNDLKKISGRNYTYQITGQEIPMDNDGDDGDDEIETRTEAMFTLTPNEK